MRRQLPRQAADEVGNHAVHVAERLEGHREEGVSERLDPRTVVDDLVFGSNGGCPALRVGGFRGVRRTRGVNDS